MLESNKTQIKKELSELLAQYYEGSFSRMACDYIHATGMTKEEVHSPMVRVAHCPLLMIMKFKIVPTFSTYWNFLFH